MAPSEPHAYANDPARRAIAAKHIPRHDPMAWMLWTAMVGDETLRSAEDADVEAAPGSLARYAKRLSTRLHEAELPLERGLRLVDKVIALVKPKRRGAPLPRMSELAEQIAAALAEEGPLAAPRRGAPVQTAEPESAHHGAQRGGEDGEGMAQGRADASVVLQGRRRDVHAMRPHVHQERATAEDVGEAGRAADHPVRATGETDGDDASARAPAAPLPEPVVPRGEPPAMCPATPTRPEADPCPEASTDAHAGPAPPVELGAPAPMPDAEPPPLLAGHTREQLAELAGAVEAFRCLEVARATPTTSTLAAVRSLLASPVSPFGDGARWALELYGEEIAGLEAQIAEPVVAVEKVLTKTGASYRIGRMPVDSGFDRLAVLHLLASGAVRCVSRATPPSAATSGATQHVVLAYLITRADEGGRVETGAKALDEALGIGRVVGARAIKALVMARQLLLVEERPRKSSIYRIEIVARDAPESERAA